MIKYLSLLWQSILLRVLMPSTCGLLAAVMALQLPVEAQTAGISAVPLPPSNTQRADARVIEAAEKAASEESRSGDGDEDTSKLVTDAALDAGIATGDVKAALAKTVRTRKVDGKVSLLINAAAIESVYDKGMADGVPEAFLAKAEIEQERGNALAAVDRLREASRRGLAEADYQLALLKLRRPDLTDIGETPLELLARAAAKGEAKAAIYLGLAAQRGGWGIDARHVILVEMSSERAMAWMEYAALLGSEEARFWLGLHYMKKTQGLADPARRKALEYLLAVRKASSDLKDPFSGKSFAQLEAEGEIEEGLLGEIKRREALEQAVMAAGRAQRTALKQADPGEVGGGERKRFDHQRIEITGDAGARRPIYNLVGLSPYKEVGPEGEITKISAAGIEVATLPSLDAATGWRVEILSAGKRLQSLVVKDFDLPNRTIEVGSRVSVGSTTALTYRLVKPHTFYSTFGSDNWSGLKPGNNGPSADEVIVYDQKLRLRRQLFFHAKDLTWVDSGTGQRLTADFDLQPGTGLLVKRTEPGTISFRVRGMIPSVSSDFEPAAGVAVVSTRKNELSAQVAGAANLGPTVASDLPVLFRKGKAERWVFSSDGRPAMWWGDLGLQASDLVKMTAASAAVVVNR